jgi:hypothetical protein
MSETILQHPNIKVKSLSQARAESVMVILEESGFSITSLNDLVRRAVYEDRLLSTQQLESAMDALALQGRVTLEVNPDDASIDVCLPYEDPSPDLASEGREAAR